MIPSAIRIFYTTKGFRLSLIEKGEMETYLIDRLS